VVDGALLDFACGVGDALVVGAAAFLGEAAVEMDPGDGAGPVDGAATFLDALEDLCGSV
jgi:hypothetical protein